MTYQRNKNQRRGERPEKDNENRNREEGWSILQFNQRGREEYAPIQPAIQAPSSFVSSNSSR
jgi:hypothetical protein